MWGNDRLAIASVNAAYEAHTTLGHARMLLVLRKPALQWQLLVAARNPVFERPVRKGSATTDRVPNVRRTKPCSADTGDTSVADDRQLSAPPEWRALWKFPLVLEPI
jgi:hypothetical protein